MAKKRKRTRPERRRLQRQVVKAAKKIGSRLGRELTVQQKFGVQCSIETKSRITFSSSSGILVYNGETNHISFGPVGGRVRGRDRKGGPRQDGRKQGPERHTRN